MNESVEIPRGEGAREIPPSNPFEAVEPFREETARRVESAPEITPELPSETPAALPTPAKSNLTPAILPPSLPEKPISVRKRIVNVLTDYNTLAVARTLAESVPVYITVAVVNAIVSSPIPEMWVAYPATGVFALWRFWHLFLPKTIKDSNFTTFNREPVVKSQLTPLGKLEFGDMVGVLHMLRGISRMAEMSALERAKALYIDGLQSLSYLAGQIENKDPGVADLRVIKATSHLVGRHENIFKQLGFTIEPYSGNLLGVRETLGKWLVIPIFGFARLLKKHSFSGFKDAASIRMDNIKTAWITPQALVAHKSQIEKELEKYGNLAKRTKQ